MSTFMKFDEKFQKISEKSQKRMDRVVIVLGLVLLVASCFSYFAIEAFAQQDLVTLDCPKNAYHGLDNQGNEACRDIQTNQILEPIIIIDSEKTTESNPWIITSPEAGADVLIVEIIILALIGIIGSFIGISIKRRNLQIFQRQDRNSIKRRNLQIFQRQDWSSIKRRNLQIFQRQGWNSIQKEQVRSRQYDKCNMCFTPPTKWKYDYIDGNKSNNDLNNCQGLCSDCISIKTKRDNRLSIYQKSN